jgi:pilus assembly protein Flp/PilA
MGFFYRGHRRISIRRWGVKRPRGRDFGGRGCKKMLQLYTGLQTWWADLKWRVSEERGATAVEYALMVALIAVVIIVAVTFLGNASSEKFQLVGDEISNAGT